MAWIFTKYLITAGLVVLISEVAKRSDKLAAPIAALPSVLAFRETASSICHLFPQ
jgi:hypothetical protein